MKGYGHAFDLFRKIRFKLSKRIFSLNTSLLVTYEFKGEKILHISQFGKDGIRCEKEIPNRASVG